VSAASSACAECRDLVGGYVLDALEPEEAERVRRHLAGCPECAAEHARLADLPALLAAAGDEEPVAERPPAALEEAVLDRFAREHRAERRADRPSRPRRLTLAFPRLRRPLPAALAGALAVAAAAVAIAVLPGGSTSEGERYSASLTGSPAAPAAHASARLETSTAGTRVALRVHGLPGNPDDVYELWCVRDDGKKVSAGTFRVDARGQAAVDLTTAAVPGEYHRMSVERRGAPAGGGERVLAGNIRYASS
jgi:anti-sigma-K factor RskA